jgi:hypothetical protein
MDDDRCSLTMRECGSAQCGAGLLMICAFVAFCLCADGINKIPKCRYGEKECYFIVQQEAMNSGGASHDTFKNMAVEGSGEYAAENLWLPVLTMLMCLIPPVLVFVSTIFEGTQRTLEVGKWFLCACGVLSLVSLRVFDELTFECRWFNVGNPNQDVCKTSFNTFAAGAVFNCFCMVGILTVAAFHGEQDRKHGLLGTRAGNNGGGGLEFQNVT